MLRRNMVWLVALVAIVAGAWVQQAVSEEPPVGPPGGPPGGRDTDQMRRQMEEMRQQMEQMRQQMMTDRMKMALGINDEEWKVLQPRIEKVQNLARQSRGGGMGIVMMGGPRGGGPRPEGAAERPQRPEGAPGRPQSDIETTAQALQKVLENKEAGAEEIKMALEALREARAKVRQELETAQKDLRAVITLRQEAVLVTMAVLD